jgi:excinuclease UvrABC helicase subunit UvrB
LEDVATDDLSLEMAKIEKAMLEAAAELRFEEAAALRDVLHELGRQGVSSADETPTDDR